MFTNFYENKILNYILGQEPVNALVQGTWHLGLFTTVPTDAGTGGVEVSGGTGYSRLPLANSNLTFDPTTTSVKTLKNSISWPEASAPWGTVKGWGLWDVGTLGSGNLCMYGPLGAYTDINPGDAARVPAGTAGMALSLD